MSEGGGMTDTRGRAEGGGWGAWGRVRGKRDSLRANAFLVEFPESGKGRKVGIKASELAPLVRVRKLLLRGSGTEAEAFAVARVRGGNVGWGGGPGSLVGLAVGFGGGARVENWRAPAGNGVGWECACGGARRSGATVARRECGCRGFRSPGGRGALSVGKSCA
jgi:hypothetical protein